MLTIYTMRPHPCVRQKLRLSLRVLSAVLLTSFCSNIVLATNLDDYRERVRQAVTALETLAQTDETESPVDFRTRATETLAGVKTTLGETEQVEWDGTIITVDNRWLHRELERYGTGGDQQDRQLLNSISERLQSLEERLTDIERAERKGLTKDQARDKLSEILKRQEYAKNAPQTSAISRILRDLIKWLESLFPKPKPLTPGGANLFTQIAQVLVILLALAVLAYALKTFLPRLLKGRANRKKTKREARIVLGETLEPDQSAGDLLAEAEALARQGDLRAAIRKAYIALLVEMGDRKLISLAQHKTNRDYLRAVRELEPLYGNLSGLTDSFERHWYGFARTTEDDWIAFRNGYKKALLNSSA